MASIPNVRARDAIRAFEKHGFAVVRQKGSHVIMKRPGWPFNLSIPDHRGKSLPMGTLSSLIDASGLTVEEFILALA